MNPTFETSSIYAMGSVVGSGGTVNATANAFATATYESSLRLAVSVGATPAGTVIARIVGGTALADTAVVHGFGTVSGGLGGTVNFDINAVVSTPFVSAQVIATGGTALCSAAFQVKPRTVTL